MCCDGEPPRAPGRSARPRPASFRTLSRPSPAARAATAASSDWSPKKATSRTSRRTSPESTYSERSAGRVPRANAAQNGQRRSVHSTSTTVVRR
jgi:hypothetical protein